MSDNNGSIGFTSLWFVLFICLKLAGTKVAAWSWWWLLFPIVPPVTELIKVLAK